MKGIKVMRKQHRAWVRITKLVLAAAVCLIAVHAAGWADNPKNLGTSAQSLNATLHKKVLGEVVDTFGQHYIVNRTTLIIDTDGRQISFGDLKVPCDVSLKTVHQGQGASLAVRIKVLHLHPGANNQINEIGG